MEIYFERQRGGRCRIHAVNMLLGREHYNDERFEVVAHEFSELYKLGNSIQHDYVTPDSHMLIGFAVEKAASDTFTFVAWERWDFLDAKNVRFLTFTPDHVWAVRTYNDEWYVLDSLKSPRKTSSLQLEKRFVAVLPIDYAKQHLIPKLAETLRTTPITDSLIEPSRDDPQITVHARAGHVIVYLATYLRALFRCVPELREEVNTFCQSFRDSYLSLANASSLVFMRDMGEYVDQALRLLTNKR